MKPVNFSKHLIVKRAEAIIERGEPFTEKEEGLLFEACLIICESDPERAVNIWYGDVLKEFTI